MTTTSKPTLAEVIDAAIAGKLARVRVMLPGVIVSYDKVHQRADVQIIVQDLVDGVPKTIPVLPDVPVLFPGYGPNRITMPVRRGQGVLVGIASSSIAGVKSGSNRVHNPRDPRHHELSDAVVLMGFDGQPATDAPDDAIEIHSDGLIRAGGDEPLAKQSDLQALRNHVALLLVGGTGSATVSCPGVGSGTSKLRG